MSDTKINHTEEAMALRTRASTPDHPSHHANLLAAAQVHATLALAEQQRIANLIALAQYRMLPGDVPIFRSLVVRAKGEYDVEPAPEIREGLGLK